MASIVMLLLISVAPTLGLPAADPSAQVLAAITPLVQKIAAKYNCSVSVGILGGPTDRVSVSFATGITDRATGREASTADPYVWGSITKMITGTAVLRLVDAGKIALEDQVPPLIDPLLAKMKEKDPTQTFGSMSEIWGDDVHKITVKDLLHMYSGLPDYDTASPGDHPVDTFRSDSYAHPDKSFTPVQLISLPWVTTGKLLFPPGTCDQKHYFNCYSSTNYVMLGLLLACQAGADDWKDYDQFAALGDFAKTLASLTFAVSGPPNAWTPVKGYDMTHYNNESGKFPGIDVSAVAGVFGGWTAADATMNALDAANLVKGIYGPPFELVSKPLVDEMYALSNVTGYGMATFNLTRLTPHDVAYGHLGATYGYQSVAVYVPSMDLGISIATNIELDSQPQPADVFCSVYNTAKAVLLGSKIPTCTFKPSYWSGGCDCK
jgi:D-alanyl-D-alanine carboxypeptidase